ncbi:MAG: class I SAM-dependent methyltransferase [Candidatus Bathyarchaeia archaeon]
MDQNIWELQGSSLHRQVRRAEAVKSMLENSKAVLDVGCAEGFITSFISKIPAYVVGIDINRDSLEVAKVKVRNVDFIQASITNLPFRERVFDAITCCEVLEHLPNPIIKEGIKEIDRALSAKGILLVSVPYREQIMYTRCIYCGKLTPLWGHLQSFDENKVSSLLPKNYRLVEKKILPNLGLISCSKIFKWLPFRIWLLMNDLFGVIRKGYWLVLRYQKR